MKLCDLMCAFVAFIRTKTYRKAYFHVARRWQRASMPISWQINEIGDEIKVKLNV